MAFRESPKSLMLVLASVGVLGIALLLLPPSENRLWVSLVLFVTGAAGGYGYAWRLQAKKLARRESGRASTHPSPESAD